MQPAGWLSVHVCCRIPIWNREVCLFHKNDQPKIFISLQNLRIESKKEMNVLGVTFDSKLNWNAQVANAICKAKKSLYALRLIHKYFNDQEMRLLLDSNFYSILYYNAVIWLNPGLSPVLKQSLLSISAKALRSCMMSNSTDISFESIQKICKKCTPTQIMSYQTSLHLHKSINEMYDYCTSELVTLLSNIVCMGRQLKF